MSAPVSSAIASHIDPEWLASRTMELVSIPSVTMDEEAVCRRYRDYLEDADLEVDVRPVTPGRTNLYARLRGTGGGPTLNLNGHLDTVPICEAWPPRRDGDRLFGRGTTDMKGGLIAALAAVRSVKDSGLRLRGDVVISAVVGHEEAIAAKDGIRAFIDDLRTKRVAADRIVIVEGGPELWVMSLGSANFKITLKSDRGGTHTNNVPFGRNPIRFLGRLIDRIHQLQVELDASERHRLAGTERVDLGIVQAGDLYNRTPTTCTLVGMRRWLPGRDRDAIAREFAEIVRPIAEEGGLTFSVLLEQDREPFETEADDRIVEAVSRAASDVKGTAPEIVGRRITGDANFYVNATGIPTIYYGASNDTAHSDHEWISLNELADSARVYALAAVNFCGLA